jgi:hypothetical protein
MNRYVRAPGVVARQVAGELVLVCTAPGTAAARAGEFFVLNDTAEALWSALERASTADELVHALTVVYDIDDARARADVHGFLGESCAAGVVIAVEE